MAEDLGEITIKFGEGGAMARGPSAGQAARDSMGQAREAARSALAGIMSNLPAFGRIVQAGAQGAGVSGVVGAARGAAAMAGGGITAGAVAAMLVPLGLTAGAAIAIRSLVGRVLDRVGELSAVSAPMALQDAANRLSEMRRDMREARVLGPMYTQISQLWNKIKDLFQPFILVVKALIMSAIIPILEWIANMLQAAFNLIPVIVSYLNAVVRGINAANTANVNTYNIMAGALGAVPAAGGVMRLLGWLFPPGKGQMSTIGGFLGTIASTLQNFYNSWNQTQGAGGMNAWALDTLTLLGAGGFPGVPAVPGVRGPVTVPIRTKPTRTSRPGRATP
jgi:hypothetical protein